MTAAGTLILTAATSRGCLASRCIAAVEAAFRRRGEGEVAPAGILGMPAEGGGFHIKAAALSPYFAVKINGNFFQNRERFGMPNIQGIVLLRTPGTVTRWPSWTRSRSRSGAPARPRPLRRNTSPGRTRVS